MSATTVQILLVEDNEAHIELIRRAFEPESKKFNLTVANTLAEARKILKKNSPDLMITDYILPDGKGTELLPGDTDKLNYPVAILTGHGDEKVATIVMKTGAMDYIVKSEQTLADTPHIAKRILREWQHISEHKKTEIAFQLLLKTAAAQIGETFFENIVHSIATWLHADCVILGEIDDHKVKAHTMVLDGKTVDEFSYPLTGSPCENAAENGFCAFQEGVRKKFPNDRELIKLRATGYAGVSLKGREGHTIGILCAIFRSKASFPPRMQEVFEIIAGRATTEMERKIAEAALHVKQAQLKSLLDISLKINASLKKENIRKSLLDASRSISNTTSAMVGLVEDERMVFREHSHGDQIDLVDYTFEPGYGVPGHVMQTLKPYISNDAAHDAHTIPKIIQELDVHQLLDVPILSRAGKLLGCFEVHNRKDGHPFDAVDIEILESLAASTAVALENSVLFEKQQQTEKILQQEKKQTRQIIDTARDVFVSMDEDGIITDWNPQAEKIFGWSRDEILGLKATETFVPEASQVAHTNGIKHYLATGKGSILNQHTEVTALHHDGHSIPVELSIVAVHSDDTIRFNAFIRDISARQEAKELLKENREQLRASLIGTIVAVSRAVGARDPYTAGHQQRVSQLSRTIAQEMELDSERIEGLRLGASIHDIGKIYLPAEILSKPSKLTDIEYALIKTHAQVGYDILKDIAFPWPVADIAHQHHERMDGTGYPQGLKGEDICLEARILAVADVVEAMSSHRPYRAALGLDAALEEIEIHRGKWFDPTVVDACLTLCRKKDFSFK